MIGKWRSEGGSGALSNGYSFESFGEEGGGREGKGIGAYVVVVVVVVTTLKVKPVNRPY